MRLRRSLIWVSGYDLNKLKVAIESDVDCIVLDLEDGVAVSQKPQARENACKALKEWDFKGKERVVRVNGLDTPFFQQDLEQVLIALPDAIRMPKCEQVEDILKMDAILADLEKKNGLAPNTIEMILMIETPMGIRNGYDLATCCERVTAMGIGMEDMTAAIGVMRNYELNSLDLLYARQKLVLDARAAGVQAIDSGVLFNGDLDYMEKDSLLDRRYGFDGRSVGDPAHVEIVNRAFSPTGKEIDWANRIITAYDKAVAEGNSEVYIDDRFVDPPVVAKAHAIQQRVALIASKKTS